MSISNWLIILITVCIWIPGRAQISRGLDRESESGGSSGLLLEDDTLDVNYFYLKNINEQFTYADTLVQYFHEYDIDHLTGNNYFNLGFPGSPARPVILIPPTFTGFSLGLHSLDPYRMNENTFRYYHLKKAFTSVLFTQGQTQDDGIFKAAFSRNFKDRINLSLNYGRQNNLGAYSHQKIRNTNLGLGFWYMNKDKSFQLFLTHFANTFEQEHNGGITTDSLFNGEYSAQRITIPVYLSSDNSKAFTRDVERIYKADAYYRLFGKDSTRLEQGFLLHHQLRFTNRRFRFSDEDAGSLGDYYQQFITDDRGIRHYIGLQTITNDFNLSFAGKTEGKQIQLGLRNNLHSLNQEPLKDNFTEWFLRGNVKWSLGERIEVGALGELGVNKENASYLVEGNLALDLEGAGKLFGTLSINKRDNPLVINKLIISQESVWEHNWKSVLINHLSATYLLPKWNLALTGGQILYSNPIYLDSTVYPRQLDEIASLSYLKVTNHFKLGHFHNENRIIFQQAANKKIFTVPTWYFLHSVYYQGRLFNTMNLNVGINIKHHSAFEGISYSPVIGNFYTEDAWPVEWYPNVDFRLSFQVKYFRAFALLENVLQLQRNDIYYQTSRYPQSDFTFRLGIGWIFLN
jgi:hypothetical protein